MHQFPPAPPVPESPQAFLEPVSADECEWIMAAARRSTLRAAGGVNCVQELAAIGRILDQGDAGETAMAEVGNTGACAPAFMADANGSAMIDAGDPVRVSCLPVDSIVDLEARSTESGSTETSSTETRSDGPCDESAAAGADPASPIASAMPLFPRSASQQRRRAATSRKRGEHVPDGAMEEASLQLALPLAQPASPRVAVGQFADRLSRVRARLAEETSDGGSAPRADVLSFADRLKKVRERLADEETAPGRVSA